MGLTFSSAADANAAGLAVPTSVYGQVCIVVVVKSQVAGGCVHVYDRSSPQAASAAAAAKEEVNYLALPTPVRYEELTREAYSMFLLVGGDTLHVDHHAHVLCPTQHR